MVGWPLVSVGDDEDWRKGCQTNMNTSNVALGGWVCANFGDSTTLNGESKMLSVSSCDNIDVLVFPDRDGSANDAATFQVYSCGNPTDASGDDPPDATWSATGICWIAENLTLDGDPATNTEAIYGLAAEWIYILAAGIDASPNTDDPLVIVRCNPASL
jgi:hypothetical protein